jgi:uncharacterized protein YqeY
MGPHPGLETARASRLAQHTKDAVRPRDKPRLAILRLVNAAIKQRDVNAAPSGKAQSGKDLISDAEIVTLMKMIK